jgi:prophage antirepressor-like protein
VELGNAPAVASRLGDDEKDAVDIIDPIGRRQRTTIINEAGLYEVLRTSDKTPAGPALRQDVLNLHTAGGQRFEPAPQAVQARVAGNPETGR